VADGSDPLIDSVPGLAPVELENTLALLARAGAGDREAANEVFTRYEERIRRIVRVRLGPSLRRWTESGDLIQETCRAAFEGLGKLELSSEFDFLDWLGRVATNRIRDYVDHVRAGKRDVARAVPLAVEPDAHSASDASPADVRTGPSGEAFRLEVRELLDEIVAGLPESYREVVLLRDYQGADWPDVARTLATPGVHAAQQLHQRAWIRVREQAAPRLTGLGHA
jgi:RNA polymerase sigma-70 factor (ECF subfamily)